MSTPKPVVNDSAAPFELSQYTNDDFEHFSIAELYRRACSALKVRPQECVAAQLPNAVPLRHSVIALNCANTYLGVRGSAAVVSVVLGCPRLTHLHLSMAGMDASVAKALIQVLLVHPGIRDVDLSKNKLGTTCGYMLLHLVQRHQRIFILNLTETLIIGPIMHKINEQLKKNEAIRESFTVPLIPDIPDPEEEARKRKQEAEERAREARAEAVRLELAERIPSWAPAALTEFAELLHKHRHNVEIVTSVFRVDPKNADSVTPSEFVHAMKVLNLHTLQDPPERACEFADLFGAFHRPTNTVCLAPIIHALRVHVNPGTLSSSLEASVTSRYLRGGFCRLLDRWYDVRETLMQSFQMLDVDQTHSIRVGEFTVGLASVVGSDLHEIEALLYAFLPDLAKDPAAPVNYVSFFEQLKLVGEEVSPQLCKSRTDWMMKRADLMKLVSVE